MNSRNAYLPDHAVSPGDVLDEHREAIGLTQAELRVAGTAYPQEVKDLYLQVAPGSIGTNARKLEDKVRAEAAHAVRCRRTRGSDRHGARPSVRRY